MGVNYTALLYLGKKFDSKEEAEEFYELHFPVSYVEEKNMPDFDGFVEFLYDHPSLSGTRTNYYTDDSPFILGFDLRHYVQHDHLLPNIINDKAEQWKTMFGDEKYDIIFTVKVW